MSVHLGALLLAMTTSWILGAAGTLGLVWFVCSIMAAVAGHGGKAYRYPLTWRIV